MASCREQCEASLKRLGVDYLDLFIFRGPFKDDHGTTVEQCTENMKVSAIICRDLTACVKLASTARSTLLKYAW